MPPVRVSPEREIRTMVGSWGTSKLAIDIGAPGHNGQVAVIGCATVGLANARLRQEAGFDVTIHAKASTSATHSLRQRVASLVKRGKAPRVASGALDLATLPPLPLRLRHLRCALLPVAMETRARLYEALTLPTRTVRTATGCIVEGLESFRVLFEFDRREIDVEFMSESGWVSEPKTEVDLLQPLPTDKWVTCFAQHMRQPLRRALGTAWDDAEVAAAAVAWIVDVVRHVAERSRLLDHVRDELRNAYPCDRKLVCDIRACTIIDPTPTCRVALSSSQYVHAWRHAPILRQRVSESHHLAAVWGLAVGHGCLQITDDYDALRNLLRDHGVTDAGWKLLGRYSRHIYRPLIGLTNDATEEIPTLCSYLRLLQRAQCREPLPFCLARALFTPYWFANGYDPAALPLGLIRGAAERVKSLEMLGGIEAFLDYEFAPVLGWLARAKPTLDANQQRASWGWFHARYVQWSEHERRQREGQRWSHGLDATRWRGFDIVPLRDGAALWVEGEQMRTCLSRYETDCAAGDYLIYSVRTGGRDRPFAHIGIRIDAKGSVTLDQVRGFANARVEPALEAFAARFALQHVRP